MWPPSVGLRRTKAQVAAACCYCRQMRPISPRLLQQLDLETAAIAEVRPSRNLLPPDPDWSVVPDYAVLVAKATRSRLGNGMAVRPVAEISARKSRHGLRPLPFLAVQERVAYSALTRLATAELPPLRRAAEDWLEFSTAPATYGAAIAPPPDLTPTPSRRINIRTLLPWSSPVKYVIKSDVVAFYRHVDHRALADQLIILGADFEVVGHLIDFLGELQGRRIGLPQLHDASDVLSEIYIDSVERNMLRRGHVLWRFNDDFRIACRGYMDALRALEDLDFCMREMGLTVNESKTTTPTFANYYMEVLGLEVAATGEVVARQEVEDAVGDYSDDFTQDAARAAEFMDRLTDRPTGSAEDEIDVREAGPAEARLIRRALAGLARARDDRAIEKVPLVVRYLAELTPSAIRYLVALHKGRVARTKLAGALDKLATRTATNDWQKMWIAHGYVEAGVMDLKRGSESRVDWLKSCAMPWSEPPLRAYSTWALGRIARISLDDVFLAQRSAPECLHLFYAAAARSVGTSTDRLKREKAFAHDLLLKKFAAG